MLHYDLLSYSESFNDDLNQSSPIVFKTLLLGNSLSNHFMTLSMAVRSIVHIA